MNDAFDAAVNDADRRIALLRKLRKSLSDISRLSTTAFVPLNRASRAVSALGRLAAQAEAVVLLPSLQPASAEAITWLDGLKVAIADVTGRRETLAGLARTQGWPIEQTGTTDHVGPFELRHTPDSTRVRFGAFLLKTVKYPAPSELMVAMQTLRGKLQTTAEHGLGEFLDAIEEAQRTLSAGDPVPWPQLVEKVIPDPKERKRQAKTLIFRLALLLSGQGPAGWHLAIVPPTLQEQRRAVPVPRLNHPNAIARIFRVRFSR